MDLELFFFTFKNIHFKSVMCEKCTQIKSNFMYARVHTLSNISTQESSQTDNGPVKISKFIYSLKSRAIVLYTPDLTPLDMTGYTLDSTVATSGAFHSSYAPILTLWFSRVFVLS